MEHDARHLFEDRYGDGHPSTRYHARLIIAGAENGLAGYGVVVIPAGSSARQVQGGPLVPGPWAATFGLCTVIDNAGGTGAEVARETARGDAIRVAAGDTVRLTDAVTVRVTIGRREYPDLTVVDR